MVANVKSLNIFALGLTLLIVTGCGGSWDSRIPKRYIVTGKVTLDGKPLEKASIIFSSAADAQLGISASGEVVNGQYKIIATPGTKAVKISNISEVKKNVFKNLIPPKYNSKTSLEAEISEENNEFDFELKSQ